MRSYCLLTEGSVWEETSDWWRGSGIVNYSRGFFLLGVFCT